MIILGNLGVANKGLITRFLDIWWSFDPSLFDKYHKKFNGVGTDMVEHLKYNEPVMYFYILDELGG